MYATKSYRNMVYNKKVNMYAEEIENSSANEIEIAVKGLSQVNYNVHMLISLVVNVAFNMQGIHGDINLKSVKTTSSSLWQSKVCINASTKNWHTENNISYTLVSVPKQDCTKDDIFFFQLNEKQRIGIPMRAGISLISSMKFLTHRQHCMIYNNRPLDDNMVTNSERGLSAQRQSQASAQGEHYFNF